MRMQTSRRTGLQLLEVTIIGSQTGSQALDEIRHRLVDVFLSELLWRATFMVINRLKLRLEFMVLFQYMAPVASGLVSPVAASDGVIPIFPSK